MNRAEQSLIKCNEETGEDKIYLADGGYEKQNTACPANAGD